MAPDGDLYRDLERSEICNIGFLLMLCQIEMLV